MIYTNYYIKNNILNKELHWFEDNLVLETITGSQMYGVNNEESDIDFLGIVMPKHEHLYPQKYGYILGFDSYPKWEHSERKGKNKTILINKREHEGEWISLTKFFYNIAVKGSPNLMEILFARKQLVTHTTAIGSMLRDNKKSFLSMRIFHAFKGYCFQQLQRIKRGYISGKSDNSTRQKYLDKHGYDIKMSYHPLRLLDQIDQILQTGDIDLMRNKDECKAMRKGEWGNFEYFESHVLKRLSQLEGLSLKTNLAHRPQTEVLHNLLQQCIEEFYGSEEKFTKHNNTEYVSAKDVSDKLEEIKDLIKNPKT